MQNRKLDIVTGLIGQIPDSQRETIDQAMVTWWANIRKDGGLRLTKHGYEILHNVLKLESWEFDLTNPDAAGAWKAPINKKIILSMDRKLKWPYYLDFSPRKKTQRVVFFGSQEAMMVTMYGNLKFWLDSIS